MSETILKSKSVLVEERSEISAASITITGSLISAEYRKAMEANYELCKSPQIKYWLQNNTEAGVLSLEDQQWVSNDLIPRAANYVEKIAVVISKDVFRKFAAKNILEKQKDKLNFQYFSSLPEAENWLKE
jgi:hypothetical protein